MWSRVRELNLLRCPLASRHHSKRVKRDGHAGFVVLTRRIDPQMSEFIPDIGALTVDGREPFGRLVVNLQIALDVFDASADGRGIQSNINQRADVFWVVAFAKVESETVIRSCLRRLFQKSNQD